MGRDSLAIGIWGLFAGLAIGIAGTLMFSLHMSGRSAMVQTDTNNPPVQVSRVPDRATKAPDRQAKEPPARQQTAPRAAPVEEPAAMNEEVVAAAPTQLQQAPQAGLNLAAQVGETMPAERVIQQFVSLERRLGERMNGLDPLIAAAVDGSGYILVAGPFPDSATRARFCQTIAVELTLTCRDAPYRGDPIELP